MGTHRLDWVITSQTNPTKTELEKLVNRGTAVKNAGKTEGTVLFKEGLYNNPILSNLDISAINNVKLYFTGYVKNPSSMRSPIFECRKNGQTSWINTSITGTSTTYNKTLTGSFSKSSYYNVDLGMVTDSLLTQTGFTISNVFLRITYTLNTYTVTFKDHDGTTLKTYTVDSGTKIGNGTSYTYPIPTNYQDNYYIYTNGRYLNVNTTVTANKTYYPTYDKTERKYQVNLTQSTGGTVTAQDTSGNQSQSSISVGYNQQVTLKAVANEGYKFKHWKDNPSNTSPNRTITVTTDGATYEAVFVPVVPKITSISWDMGADHLIAGTGVTTLTVTVEEVEE